MKATTLILASLLTACAVAQPHRQHRERHNRKRDSTVVWVTDFDYVTETVAITTTIWIPAGYTPPASAAVSSTSSSSAVAAQFFEPASSPVIPAPAAPTSSSTPAPAASTPAYVAPQAPVTPEAPAYVAPVESSPVQTSAPAPAAAAPVVAAPAPVVSAPSPVAAAATTPASDSSSGGQCSSGSPCEGDITFYTAGLGACGTTDDGDAENLVALPYALMGTQSNGNPYCGKTITITCTATGKTTTAKVVDKCMGCQGFAIDLSNKAFSELDDFSVGRTGATWHFN